MFLFLSEILKKKNLDCFAPIPLKECRIQKPYLLERAGIADGTAVMLAVPYFSPACMDPARNLSAYAVAKDYHVLFRELFDEILPILRAKFPQNKFEGFADHSPLAETEAAAKAGLGIIGENRLLLTEKYSSYIFLGEIITDAKLPCHVQAVSFCEHCGACLKACPAADCGGCLSALTQKKGALTEIEKEKIIKYGSVWGCDICQEVCPHTVRAIKSGSIFSPIPYFREDNISHLTKAVLDGMTDRDFQERAFSWRGRDTIGRNLRLFDTGDTEKKGDEPTC